jgi:hypothetical protein
MAFVTPDWTSDDALHLRAFLETTTGQKVFQMLSLQRPGFFADDASQETSFARSRSIAGYERALSELVNLTTSEHTAPTQPKTVGAVPEMPDLDDDSQWPAVK